MGYWCLLVTPLPGDQREEVLQRLSTRAQQAFRQAIPYAIRVSLAIKVSYDLAVVDLARGAGLDLPIAEAVAGVCHEGWTATDALESLLARETGFEHDGIMEGRAGTRPQ